MKNKFLKAAAGLLAMALAFGCAPAKEEKGIFGGLGTTVTAYAAATTVTWDSSNAGGLYVDGNSKTIDGITMKSNAGDVAAVWRGNSILFDIYHVTGGFTFTNNLGGNFTKIEITAERYPIEWEFAADDGNLGSGWSYSSGKATWTGDAASVDLLTSCDDFMGDASSIVFTVGTADVNVTSVSLDKTTAQTINVDENVAFTATVEPNEATDKTVKWSTDNTNVKLYSDPNCTTEVGANATSTLKVYAKGISAGDATVTVTSNADATKTASCAVTVKDVKIADTYKEIEGTDGTIGWCLNKSGNAVYLIYRLKATEDELKDYDFISILDNNKNTIIPSDEIAEGEDGYQGKFNTVYTAVQFPDNSEIAAGENEYLIAFELSGITTEPEKFTIITGVNE